MRVCTEEGVWSDDEPLCESMYYTCAIIECQSLLLQLLIVEDYLPPVMDPSLYQRLHLSQLVCSLVMRDSINQDH